MMYLLAASLLLSSANGFMGKNAGSKAFRSAIRMTTTIAPPETALATVSEMRRKVLK
jgi:hypothetical protein